MKIRIAFASVALLAGLANAASADSGTNTPTTGFDVFRLEDGKTAEPSDVSAPANKAAQFKSQSAP